MLSLLLRGLIDSKCIDFRDYKGKLGTCLVFEKGSDA